MTLTLTINPIAHLKLKIMKDYRSAMISKGMLVAAAMMLSSAIATAQTYAEANMSKKFYEIDEFTAPEAWSNEVLFRDAKFAGGSKALTSHIHHHFVYPQEDIKNGIEGKVVAKFVINEYGRVDSAYIVKSVSETIDNALLLAIETMPPWEPAIRNGKPVKAYVTLPFKASVR